jgi:hypothetical protein
MDTLEATDSSHNYYFPSAQIVRYIAERLQYERLELKKKRAGEDLSERDNRFRHKLATDKVRVLDKIFQAMADLSYFLESISAHIELQEIFDDDLKELLGLKIERQKSFEKHNNRQYWITFNPDTLSRLLRAMVAMDKRTPVESENDKSQGDFRLLLPHLLQQVILAKVQRYTMSNSTESVIDIMNDDLARASAWTQLYASRVLDDKVPYRRAIGYSFRPVISSRSYTEELDSHGTFAEDR